MKFALGKLVVTHGVNAKMQKDERFHHFVMISLDRYRVCDWGELSDNDKKANVMAVQNGDERIIAAYNNKELRIKIWIITESNRSVTTVLFPHEY